MTILHGLLVDLVPASPDWPDKMYEFWNNESRLWATMGDSEPTSRAAIQRIHEHRSGARERGYTGVPFMMRTRDGRIIGNTGLNWVNLWSRTGSVGAWIGEAAYWGGGHGSDALLLVVDYAFNWLDLRRLDLSTMSINERAQRNVEKCGFTFEGRRRQMALVNGQWVDEMCYGLLREEWPGREVLVEQMGLRQRAIERYGRLVDSPANETKD